MKKFALMKAALCWLERVLEERYGHRLKLEPEGDGVALRIAGAQGRILFDHLDDGFSQGRSDLLCGNWDAEAEGWESVLGLPLPTPGVAVLSDPLIELDPEGIVVHYDVLGMTFWMLARVEEIGRNDLDEHHRFPARASHAFQHGYLDRPVVDEWLHVLGQVLQRQWPSLPLKEHRFEVKVSHDVDRPSRYAFGGLRQWLRAVGGDLLKRRQVASLARGPMVRWLTHGRLHPADPYNTFDWIMDVSEEHELRSAFYFISGRTDPAKDGDYELEHPAIRDLLRRIHARGHEIGLHPSYGTYQSPELIAAEAERLRRVCTEEGIQQEAWGGRMHYLRWKQPTTLHAWAAAGMAYDSTMSYADHAGFRCGTCFEYPGFDPVAGIPLSVRVRPLIAMECSVLGAWYMGLKHFEALEQFRKLKERCRAVQGVFSLLWHNSELCTRDDRYLYKSVLRS